MEIGTHVIHRGRVYVLVGVEPMSVPDRRAQLEDAITGERFRVPLVEIEPAPKRPDGPGFVPAA
jgi:hypothetical protein